MNGGAVKSDAGGNTIREAVRAMLAERIDADPDEIEWDDELTMLGVDSISLMAVLEWHLARTGIRIPFTDAVSTRTIGSLGDLLESSAEDRQGPQVTKPVELPDVDPGRPFGLSVMSQAYWAGQHLDEGATPIVAHFYHEFDGGPVDVERMERACRLLYERNPMLRAVVTAEGTQYVRDLGQWRLPVEDLRELDAAAVEERLLEIREERAQSNMRPERGEVFEVGLALLPGARSRTFVKLYMGVADAMSFKMALEQLAANYRDPEAPWHEPGISYAQYVTVTAEPDASHEADRAWWASRLDSVNPAPEFPPGRQDGHVHSRRLAHQFTPEQWRDLQEVAASLGVTPTVLVLTVFGETLGAWSTTKDFVVNMPVFRRADLHPDVPRLVGDFTGSLLVNLSTGGAAGLSEKVRDNSERVAEALAHSRYSGVEVLRDLNRGTPERRTAPVVFTSALGIGELFSADFIEIFGPPSWVVSQGPTVLVDCQISVLGGRLCVNWDVREGVVDDTVVDAMFTSFVESLGAVAEGGASAGPVRVPEVQLKVRAARREAWLATARELGSLPAQGRGAELGCLHTGFFATASTDPDRVAVIDATGEHTFGEIASAAAGLAGWLRTKGIGPGERVVVCCHRGVEQVIACVGVLAAGGCYVPVDVNHPEARRGVVVNVCGARWVICGNGSAGDGGWCGPERLVDLADVPVEQDWKPESIADDPDCDAYVIFTSGSTGEPKGVVMTHRGAMTTIDDVAARWGTGAGDRGLMVSSLGFDLSVFDLFGVMGRGGSLVIPPPATYADPGVWVELVTRHGVNLWNSAPAQASMLLDTCGPGELAGLRFVLVSGDWVPVDLGVRLWEHNPRMTVVAGGGATEAGIWSNCHVLAPGDEDGASIPYGIALSGQDMDVVDTHLNPCPDLVAGDIVIAGDALARGYENDPELTARKFITDPRGRRIYLTGDRGRWSPNGEIEFLGRLDTQVKIHGHRIELTDVEHAIASHPEVAKAVVVASEGMDRAMYGAVVPVPGADPGIDELIAWQADRIPWPCSFLSLLDEFPLTRNGKVDRKALLSLLLAAHQTDDETPGTRTGDLDPVARQVADFWQEQLGVPVRGGNDDFFLLGGDSLIASRVISRMRRAGWQASLATVFTNPRLADFAAGCTPPTEPVVTGPVLTHDDENALEPFDLTEVQRAYLVGRDPGLVLGGVDCIFYREYRVESVDENRLGEAVDAVVARHPMLRAIVEDERQRVLPQVPSYRVIRAGGQAAERMRAELAARRFEPSSWPPFDIRVLDLDGATRVCVATNSLILDAASVLNLQREIDTVHAGEQLPHPPEIDFRDYVTGHLSDAAGRAAELSAARRHWAGRVEELPASPALPLAREPEEIGVPVFEREFIEIDASTWSAITRACRNHQVTPSALVLASFCETLRVFSGQDGVSVTVTVFDRPAVHPDIEQVMGDFTSLLVSGYRVAETEPWATRVRRVSENLAEDLEHVGLGMAAISRLARDAGGETGFPVVFTSALGVEQSFGGDGGLFRECTGGMSATGQVWLDHQVSDDGHGGVRINWDHVKGLFPPGFIASAITHQRRLLDFAATGDWNQTPVPGVTETERAARASHLRPRVGAPRTLHAPFVELATAQPDAIAMIGADGSEWTRGRLLDGALRVASWLRTRNMEPREQVMVSLSDPALRVVAILGVLLAGGSYVPVGVDHPEGRIASIRNQTGLRLVLDDAWASTWNPGDAPPQTGVDDGPAVPTDIAYTIFTSGSTGEPKGVMLSHAQAAATIDAVIDRWSPEGGWRGIGVSAIDFDLSVFDLFGTLGSGGLLVLVDDEHRRDAQHWAAMIAEHQLNYWNTVPTLLEMLLVSATPGELDSLRSVIVSGDRVPLNLDQRLRDAAPRATLVAMGGATEAAIWSNWFEPASASEWRDQVPGWAGVPYGYPLAGQAFDVLTPAGVSCPDWVVGELTISGCGVAEGYIGEDQGGFFTTDDGRRKYRTGDLGRFRPGGLLEILGRSDDQIKVRGHRITTGEVEVNAEALTGVDRAAAGVVQGSDGAVLALAATLHHAPIQPGPLPVPGEVTVPGHGPSQEQRLKRIAGILTEVIAGVRDPAATQVVELWRAWLARNPVAAAPSGPDVAVVDLLTGILNRHRPVADLVENPATDVARQIFDQPDSAAAVVWLLERARTVPAARVGWWTSTAVAARLAEALGAELTGDALIPTGEVPCWVGGGFDLVLAPLSMHTFPDPARALRRARAALAPGGLLIAVEIESLAPEAMLSAVILSDGFGHDPARLSDPARGNCHTVAEWADLAALVGLELVEHVMVSDTPVRGFVLHRPEGVADLDADRIRYQLSERLPGPLVPRVCEIIDNLPTTRNGKVDRGTAMAALPTGRNEPDTVGQPPLPGLEELVASCWRDLLGATKICREDSLFDHGGDSLSAARLVGELELRVGVRLSLRKILETPSVAGIAAALTAAGCPEGVDDVEEGEL